MEAKTAAENRKLYHNFDVIEKYEAGIELKGSEVKSIREGKVDIKDAYCVIRNFEMWLINCRIANYGKSSVFRVDPLRDRRLLLHKKEIKHLIGKLTRKGLTLKPIRIFFNKRGFVKVELGLCKAIKIYDKREKIRKKEVKKEIERYL